MRLWPMVLLHGLSRGRQRIICLHRWSPTGPGSLCPLSSSRDTLIARKKVIQFAFLCLNHAGLLVNAIR